MAEREGEKGERWRERERSKDVARTLLRQEFLGEREWNLEPKDLR